MANNAVKRFFIPALAVLIALFAVSGAVWALEPFKIEEYVTDRAGMMTEDKRGELAAQLAAYATQTGNQLLVVTLPNLEGEELVDFSERLFALNQPGEKGKDNGLIFLVALKERKIRIEVGYGLEEAVPDGKAGTIIREVIAPYFKNGAYEQGIIAGVAAVVGAISPDYQGFSQSASVPRGEKSSPLKWIFVAFFILIIFAGRNSGLQRRRYRSGYSEPFFWGGGPWSGGGSGGGGFGGGGFSGGGGGFGGGGASGGW